MTTKILGTQIENFSITTEQLAANTTVNFVNKTLLSDYANNATFAVVANSLAPKITSIAISNSTFTLLDDTAVNTGGGYIVVTGDNFDIGATVLVDTTSASSVSRINSTTLNVQVPAKSAASYNLYVVNPDGGTGVKVSGITYSDTPTWVTTSPLNEQVKNYEFNLNLSATSATSYAVANGSSLPAGTALLANGYFYGNVTSISADTTYSFDVVATDAENQDSSKTFGVTVYLTIQPKLWLLTGLSSPAQIGTDTDWNKVSHGAQGGGGIMATKTTGTLWAWGDNNYGQLGLNDRTTRSLPVQVGSLTNWSNPSISNRFMGVIKTNGTLWACGSNSYGENATNDRATVTNRSSPIQVGALTDWSILSVFGNNGMAMRTNGTLYGWGRNQYGHVGLNNRIVYSSPVQVGSAEWSKVSARLTVLAIKTNGTLWSWGRGTGGQLGSNAILNRSSPVQVGTDTNWSEVSASFNASMVIKTNGTLWAWGTNSYGQLGLNDLISRSSPVQVGTLTNWSKVSSHTNFVYAIKTDNTLWAWGGTRSSPVQVGTKRWLEVSVGDSILLVGG